VPVAVTKRHVSELIDTQAAPIFRRPGRSEPAATIAAELIEEGLPLAAFVDADRVGTHFPVVATVGGEDLLLTFDSLADEFVSVAHCLRNAMGVVGLLVDVGRSEDYRQR
jgi:hypothetical protein